MTFVTTIYKASTAWSLPSPPLPSTKMVMLRSWIERFEVGRHRSYHCVTAADEV